jgi:hypothetical protein
MSEARGDTADRRIVRPLEQRALEAGDEKPAS